MVPKLLLYFVASRQTTTIFSSRPAQKNQELLIANNLLYWHRIGFDEGQISTMTHHLPKTVLFITGTCVGTNCWDEWKIDFESKGYTCLAPAWPHKNASPEELRNRHPDSAIATNRLNQVTEFFAEIIIELPEKPILIGHSLGGLIVELLLQKGLGLAGVAVHSFPSVTLSLSYLPFLKGLLPAMGFFTSPQKSYMISFRKWKRTITNGMTYEEQKRFFYLYAIPESKLIFRDVFSSGSGIDYAKDRPPLLFISGSRDKFISASLIFANYEKYRSGNSITDYRDFKGRNHLSFKHPLWKEEIDFVLFWLQRL